MYGGGLVGPAEPLSGEKLTTVLGWYEADGWEAGCERSIELRGARLDDLRGPWQPANVVYGGSLHGVS